MGILVLNTKTVSGQSITIAKGETVSLGLSGPLEPATYQGLAVVPTSQGSVSVADSTGPTGTRAWSVTGNTAGSATLEAKYQDQVLDSVTVTVVDTPEQAFIASMAAAGAAIARKYKLPVSLMIAQACLESGFGKKPHALAHNVLYGITKRKELSQKHEPDWYPACQTVALLPTVAVKGQDPVPDRFCSAFSLQEAVEIWGQYVSKHPHSKSIASLLTGGPWSDETLTALANHMHTALRFGAGVDNYGAEVMRVIKQFTLTKYD